MIRAWVRLNVGESALLRISNTAEMIDRLTPAIRSQALPPIDRAYLLDDQVRKCFTTISSTAMSSFIFSLFTILFSCKFISSLLIN